MSDETEGDLELEEEPDAPDDPESLEVINELFGEEAEPASADGEGAVSEEAPQAPPAEGEPASEEAAAEEPSAEPAAQSTEEIPPETPAQVTPEAPEAAVSPPAPAPTEPAAEPAPPADSSQQPPVLTAEQLQEQFTEHRKVAVDHLAKHYQTQLTEDALVGLDPDAAEPISRLMGQVYIDAVSTAMTQIARILPTAVQNATHMTDANREAEETFFTKWPQLREHTDTVQQLAAAYRAQNPGADIDTFNQQVGAMAHVSLGLPLEAPVAEPVPDPAPAAPFVPAGRTAPSTNSAAPPANEFAQMAQEFSENMD